MSLIASAVVDLVETKVRQKGRNLLKAVRVACGGGESFTAALYAHPRVEVLYEGDTADTGSAAEDRGTVKELLTKLHSTKGLPSFIPNDTFARAFLETLVDCKVEELGDLKALFAEERRPWHIKQERSLATIQTETLARKPKDKTEGVILQLAGVAAPPHVSSEELDDAYCVMRPIVIEADGNVDRTLELLGEHFDKVNERCKGWYKHWVTKCLLVVGLIMAIGTNGDSVRIVGRLNADPALRESMLKLAESLERQGVAGSQAGVAAVSEAKLEAKSTTKETATVPSVPQSAVSREQILKDLRTSEAISGGWANDPVLEQGFWSWKGLFAWLLKILGLAATGAAISLGAPFWFHLLQSLLKLRSLMGGKSEQEDKDAETKPTVAEVKQQLERVAMEQASPVKSATCAEVKRAAEFARYSDFSYLTESEFKAKLGDSGAWSVRFVSESAPKVDTQVFVLRNAGRLVLVFRGTEPKVPADLVTDAEFGLEKQTWLPNGSSAAIHHGFSRALDVVWAQLSKEWSPAAEGATVQIVEFCGHSLGGALALLAAVRFAAESAENRKRFGGVYTIGQPRVGNAAFAQWAAPLLGGRYVRAVNNRDAVPRVPPHATDSTLGDYTHFGTVHYFDASGALSIDPGWFYRFLDYTLPSDELKGANSATWISELKEAGTDHNSADYASLYGQALCTAA